MTQKEKLRTMCRGRFPVLDFDKFMARTDLRSPNGFTVSSAYAWAFERIFNSVTILPAIGGFTNEAPGELALAAFRYDRSLYQAAERYYLAHKAELAMLVPKTKGFDLEHARAIGNEVDFMTELLARVKLQAFAREVGAHRDGVWPLPVEGMADFLRSRYGQGYGIITSGHDLFVQNTLAAWQAPLPAAMITDDDMRAVPLPVAEKTKPSKVVMETWISRAERKGIRLTLDDIVFGGDDLRTDGGLAHNSGTWFVWYNPDGLSGDPGERGVEIRHIDELTEAFR